MAKPISVTISHDLGAERARRQIAEKLEELRVKFASVVTTATVAWTGPHADVVVGVMGQSVRAGIDVGDDTVRVTVELPMMLAWIAPKVDQFLAKTGRDTLRIGPMKG